MAGTADRQLKTSPRHWLIAVALVSIAIGVLAFVRAGLVDHVLGAIATSVIPSVMIGLHNQRAQRRRSLLGEFPARSFLVLRRAMVLACVALAALHGYFFALALEQAALS